MFTNVSKYPVFDIFAEWIDLDEPVDFESNKFWTRNRINLGTVHPNKAVMGVFGFDLSERKRLRINIFIQTRNSGLTQQIHVAKGSDSWKVAIDTKSEKFNEVKIPADFPGYDPEHPEKVFAT